MKVTWDEKICIYSAKCIKNLSFAFTKQDGKFVIVQNGVSEDQIKKVVKECLSAVLKIEE